MNLGRADVVVLGAGLAGAGVALELARRGIRVTLLDRDIRPLNRASLRNEGKIHLGFIYANDLSRGTAYLQLEGALGFRRIVGRWLGPEAGWLAASAPFHYLVARDSITTPGSLADHYVAVEARYRQRLQEDAGLDYLGDRPSRLVRPLEAEEIARYFDGARFAAGFATEERAIDTDALASSVRLAIERSLAITFLPSHFARAISETSGGFHIEGEEPGGTWGLRAHQIVNATWERRLALDQQLGISPPEDLLHRLKFRLICRLPRELRQAPSVSMVLGPYGDMVVRRDGTAYLSWYPAGLRGWSHEIEPPADWDSACRGEVPSEQAREIASEIMAGIDTWFPGVARSDPLLVDAGVIVALGRSDVGDSGSALHQRFRIGVTSRGGYHSLDPGKLTTAPLFALETADRVETLHSGRALQP